VKRWGDRRAAVELTERRELLRASEGDDWFLSLILRDAAIRQNVVDNVAKLKSATPILNAAIEQRKPSVVGAIYHLKDGKIEIIR
jgi:carbonic anhydrase